MIESKIEKILKDKYTNLLNENEISSINTVTSWECSDFGVVKNMEECDYKGFLTIKCNPRSYATFTIPESDIKVDINLMMRYDVDYTGKDILSVCDLISDQAHKWQKSYDTYYNDFVISNEYEPTGFREDGGDFGVDKQNQTWQFSQSYVLQGIIQN